MCGQFFCLKCCLWRGWEPHETCCELRDKQRELFCLLSRTRRGAGPCSAGGWAQSKAVPASSALLRQHRFRQGPAESPPALHGRGQAQEPSLPAPHLERPMRTTLSRPKRCLTQVPSPPHGCTEPSSQRHLGVGPSHMRVWQVSCWEKLSFDIICGCNYTQAFIYGTGEMRLSKETKELKKVSLKTPACLKLGRIFLLTCPVRTHSIVPASAGRWEERDSWKNLCYHRGVPGSTAWGQAVPKHNVSDLLTCSGIQGISSCSL